MSAGATLVAVLTGAASLAFNSTGIRAASGAIFLIAFCAISACASDCVLGDHLDLDDRLLLGIGTATGLCVGALLLLAALDELRAHNAVAALLAISVVLGVASTLRRKQNALLRPMLPRASPHYFVLASVLVVVASALAVTSVVASVHSFRNADRPLATVSLAASRSTGVAVSIKNLTSTSEKVRIVVQAENQQCPPTGASLRGCSDHTGVELGMASLTIQRGSTEEQEIPIAFSNTRGAVTVLVRTSRRSFSYVLRANI